MTPYFMDDTYDERKGQRDANDGAERDEQRGQTYRVARKERRPEREESGGGSEEPTKR